MFDRFIRLARAKKALREQRYFDALQQASDPLIEDDRRSEAIRAEATQQLIRRAEARLEGGDVSTALVEAKRLRQVTSGEAVDDLVRRCDRAGEQREQASAERRTTRAEFRRLVDAGQLAKADALLATLAAGADGLAEMHEHLAQRRRQATDLLAAAVKEAERGHGMAGLETYRQAVAIDDAPLEAARASALRKLAQGCVDEIEAAGKVARADVDQLVAALAAFDKACRRLPGLRDERAMAGLQARLVEAVDRHLKKLDAFAPAAALGRAAAAAGVELGDDGDRAVAALVALDGDGKPESRVAALAQLEDAAGRAGYGKLARKAHAGLADNAAGEHQLTAARELLEAGQLDAARQRFVAFLDEHPMHEGVRKELELLDESMADLDRRLADVRMALRSGRLREACTAAMSLVGTERIAGEAQQILAEARSRMKLVDKGLDEVRVSLHGRAAATTEGVRHCLKRLEELQKVQVDHVELPKLIAAVQAEIDALEQCETAARALENGNLDAVAKAVPELVAVRGELLGVERIDAKLCLIGDGILQHGERALGDGRLAQVQRCGGLLRQLEAVRADFVSRADAWRCQHDDREARVADLLQQAKAALKERDLAEAERCVEQARQQWRESAEAQAFAHQLSKLRKQTHTLEQVAAMTEEKDFLGAHQKLAAMPNVPPMLRTRVFDMKQDLAKAQGLEGAFLLRVDEGGEQLVMRGESVSVGNVRQGSADLPVLANLAGRHASIRRSMSFHGGMEDTVVAEQGEVHIGRRKVDKHVLKSGDLVRFGPALGAVYQRPTSRSLTSKLTLQSGFQVAGTDRVLLMKDRGRDGRILIGPGRDVHVTVSRATGEVELFANNSGQMRIYCEAGGSIDGTVFKGEHPVAAGQIVEACGITFLLLPWQPVP
jgi:hypothetical protein